MNTKKVFSSVVAVAVLFFSADALAQRDGDTRRLDLNIKYNITKKAPLEKTPVSAPRTITRVPQSDDKNPSPSVAKTNCPYIHTLPTGLDF